jgi:hypothetical protein
VYAKLYWSTFDPTDPKEVILQYRSSPWDDIVSEEDKTRQVDELASTIDDDIPEEDVIIQDSSTTNLLARPLPPTDYNSVVVQPARTTVTLPDILTAAILQQGVHLPPPRDPTPVFVKTHESQLVSEVIQDLLQHEILVPNANIIYAFRLFLVAKPSGAAGPVYDMSPWTPLYEPPPIRLYSAAEVLATIPRNSWMIEVDLKSGFFFRSLLERSINILQSILSEATSSVDTTPNGTSISSSYNATSFYVVVRHLHQKCNAVMVAYLDDWLFSAETPLPVKTILKHINALGITINRDKSILDPTRVMVYLGLSINSTNLTMMPTTPCLKHLLQLATIVNQAST